MNKNKQTNKQTIVKVKSSHGQTAKTRQWRRVEREAESRVEHCHRRESVE